ncbi:NADPH-dependent 1-acyl dihydroxyacetone phosphate reductase [Talaromyces marneffei ATCC 18224]
MPKHSEQKSVLITGNDSCTPGGIGHALCHEFHRRVLADLAEAGVSTVQMDVTDPISIQNCHKIVSELTNGRLDILVNNAGRTHVHPALDLSIQDVRSTFEVNVFGVMAVVAAFSDLLIRAKGLIINIASLAALTSYVFGSAYCASKGAVVSYSRTLRQELRPLGVRVMVCMVGVVHSNVHNREHRSLPPTSVYLPVQDVYEQRLQFANRSDAVDTHVFAETVVSNALKSEVPWFLRNWVGRPDWLWCGAMARPLWWGYSFFGEWLIDYVCSKMFDLGKLEDKKHC